MRLAAITDEDFAAIRLALALAQDEGTASPPGSISYVELAAWFDTTPQDIRLHELSAIEKLRQHPVFRDEIIHAQ